MTVTNEHVNAGTETLVTHAAVRLTRTGQDKWTVVRLDSRRQFRINSTVAVVLDAHAAGSSPEQVRDRLRDQFPLSEEMLTQAISRLREYGLLVRADDVSSARAHRVSHAWARHNWRRAADYYLATFDYPFVDYASPTALETDRTTMIEYVAAQPDTERTKSYPADERTLPPTEPTRQALRRLTVSLPAALSGAVEPGELTAETLGVLMSVAFGRLRTRRARMTGRAPLIRRTSPSGGSRHPTEGYVLTDNVPGLVDGIYHYDIDRYRMHRLTDSVPIAALLKQPTAGPGALILMTSVFERNMYRYREPRTFRTVHMDAGHLAATVDITASALGLHATRRYDLRHADIERLLDLHQGQEGSMCGVLIREVAS